MSQSAISQGYPLWLMDSEHELFLVVGWQPSPIWPSMTPLCVPLTSAVVAGRPMPRPVGVWTVFDSDPSSR